MLTVPAEGRWFFFTLIVLYLWVIGGLLHASASFKDEPKSMFFNWRAPSIAANFNRRGNNVVFGNANV